MMMMAAAMLRSKQLCPQPKLLLGMTRTFEALFSDDEGAV